MRERLCSGYGRAIDLHIVSIAGWTATVVLGGDIQKSVGGVSRLVDCVVRASLVPLDCV